MGPEPTSRTQGTTSRPRFPWDLKSVQSTGFEGPKDEYAEIVAK